MKTSDISLREAGTTAAKPPVDTVVDWLAEIASKHGVKESDAETTRRREIAEDLVKRLGLAESAPLSGEVIPLRERAVGTDGLATIKLIQPGWGSSGYYGKDLLERDGAKTFPVGTKMFWDHLTESEERERPEGSLNNLAAEIVSPPKFMEGADGPGLYAEAKVFEPFREAVNELAPHIGVSIRADGRAHLGEAEGRRGQIVDELVAGHSVDFVTTPGAGGKITQLFESYRGGKRMPEQNKPNASDPNPNPDPQPNPEPNPNPNPQPNPSPDPQPNPDPTPQPTTEADRSARLEEKLAMREARDIVDELLKAKGNVPVPTANRLRESLPLRFTLNEQRDLDVEAFKKLAEAQIDSELTYLNEVAPSGRVLGMGASTATTISEADAKKNQERIDNGLAALSGRPAAAQSKSE